MRTKPVVTVRVPFCKSRLPEPLGNQLLALKRLQRGKTVAFIVVAHTSGLDLKAMIQAGDSMHRLGVLLNQRLRVSKGSAVDTVALAEAVALVKGLWP